MRITLQFTYVYSMEIKILLAQKFKKKTRAFATVALLLFYLK